MAKLWLKTLKAYANQEWPRDELYMKLDGSKVWDQGGVEVGDSFYIGKTYDISGYSDKIDLFEDDSWPNGDEYLGSHTVYNWETGLGEQTATFNLEGSNYQLTYEVYNA
ncbi:hypothetical protein [Lyngbya aestuarii]|uniref:hypothetical protein n=1 Tax=Lyngbya aestuarii TaxID=118322 RepID=UPI00403D89E0